MEPIPLDEETVECPDGCPFVIYRSDWEYHLGWHAEMAKPIWERYPEH